MCSDQVCLDISFRQLKKSMLNLMVQTIALLLRCSQTNLFNNTLTVV